MHSYSHVFVLEEIKPNPIHLPSKSGQRCECCVVAVKLPPLMYIHRTNLVVMHTRTDNFTPVYMCIFIYDNGISLPQKPGRGCRGCVVVVE